MSRLLFGKGAKDDSVADRGADEAGRERAAEA